MDGINVQIMKYDRMYVQYSTVLLYCCICSPIETLSSYVDTGTDWKLSIIDLIEVDLV